MEPSVQAAVIAGVVALVVAGLSNFGAESFKRHRDAVALAAGIAGELRGYAPAFNEMRGNLLQMLHRASSGHRLQMPRIARPSSPVFDGNVSKLGVLGVQLAEQVSFVYSCIGAFRSMMEVVQDEDADATRQAMALISALDLLERLAPLAEVVDRLHKFSKREWLEPLAH